MKDDRLFFQIDPESVCIDLPQDMASVIVDREAGELHLCHDGGLISVLTFDTVRVLAGIVDPVKVGPPIMPAAKLPDARPRSIVKINPEAVRAIKDGYSDENV